MDAKLTASQTKALAHFTEYAADRKQEADRTIREVLHMCNIARHTYEEAVAKLQSFARVGLHFHPDRPDREMRTVAEGLLEHGVYKSQFETLLSNGSVSAYPGGARDNWERTMFAGAYHLPGTVDGERPKYGALDLMRHPDGPAPRFGSCYFLLAPHVSRRCTFTYADSHLDPREKGTYAAFDLIMAALLNEAFAADFAVGEKPITPPQLIDRLLKLDRPLPDPASREAGRNLNHYIEAQVHGDIRLREDVEALVADPSFRHTPTGDVLERLCRKYAIRLDWHMGFVLPAEDVPADFRGPSMPSLARRIARRDWIDANAIGQAAVALKRDPAAWADRGTYEETLQELKLLWHVLVRYGKPLSRL